MSVAIESVSKQYPNGVRALTEVSVTIEVGMFGLLGPNGAGKTTLLKTIATLIAPTSGRVTVMGHDVVIKPQKVRRYLGYLPQEFGLYQQLTGWEFLDYVGCLKGLKRRRQAATEALEAVGLIDVARRRVSTYSGGMKQRLGIAQALLGSPPVLIVDEPTVGLDPAERIRFRNLLAQLAKDRVVILSTHIVGDIERSCDTVGVLRAGRLIFCDCPQRLTQKSQGHVWEVPSDSLVHDGRLEQWQIVSTQHRVDGLTLRVISEQKPHAQALSVESTLEDAYMYLLGGVL